MMSQSVPSWKDKIVTFDQCGIIPKKISIMVINAVTCIGQDGHYSGVTIFSPAKIDCNSGNFILHLCLQIKTNINLPIHDT